MNTLNEKINEHFSGLVVKKDLVKVVKGNAIVPSYVLEYLLGQYCATTDEASIKTGIDTVKEILEKHFVHRNEAGLIKSVIKEKGRHKVIDRVHVDLNEKTDTYEATFSNLGIKKILVSSSTVKKHPKLLVGGVWCICDLEYQFFEDHNISPFVMQTIKPIQMSNFDLDGYLDARKKFKLDEWIDLLIQSMGFNPEMFDRRSKLTQLIRLIPYCERNYNLIELGPKGTGKSHIYSEFSPHGILISGGEVTVPKLFANNSNGKIGLVGYWDSVAFDEFAGKKKRVDKALVDIMKNYMANKSFSRGVDTQGAEASMVFVGNTQHKLAYMLKHTDLFDELPDKYYDSAFLDRLHFYIPGWEVDIIRGEMFTDKYGFIVDYLAEILRTFRNNDFSQLYTQYFSLNSKISTRDKDGIQKSFSGLMKILFPHEGATKDEVEELLKFAMEGRKRVKDQVMRIDPTYESVVFGYKSKDGLETLVKTLEEEQYPQYFNPDQTDQEDENANTEGSEKPEVKFENEQINSDTIKKIIKIGENKSIEYKSSMGYNYHTKQQGKEIEHAIVKTIASFVNTDGGVLLVGVKDDGEILGLKPDYSILGNKGNPDGLKLKLDSLIDAKLGNEVHGLIDADVVNVDGQEVLYVKVNNGPKEIFVNGDEFYVRGLASSRSLSGKEMMEYIKIHW